ncbi:MAG: hypothetical protein F4190_02455 [Acidimicrobiales bacterium]|nr:hypothetical protein [Acidimicrobiales bacterium]MYI26582.1 hypothetical protein [Acidimicrobiales bacterium]
MADFARGGLGWRLRAAHGSDRASGRSERGEVLPLLIVWPAVVVLLLLLGVQALLVTGARSQAEAAASAGLRAIWNHAAAVGDVPDPAAVGDVPDPAADSAVPLAGAAEMAAAAHDAVAHAAATGDGWRWWTPGASVVRSDWCHSGADALRRPASGEAGWVQVEVTGEVFGPFSALWPGRLDAVHATASGPAVLAATNVGNVPAALGDLSVC